MGLMSLEVHVLQLYSGLLQEHTEQYISLQVNPLILIDSLYKRQQYFSCKNIYTSLASHSCEKFCLETYFM